MITLRKSGERGHANHGWLDSRFTFSFADYYDPDHMGFASLRVINDDWIAPASGFPMHPHRNMEILTYVLEGAIEHRDSSGHDAVLRPGEVQYMSAGRGIRHSEFNPSATEPLHSLQIWILPNQTGGEPDYQQKYFGQDLRQGRLCPAASPDGRDGSIKIKQDAVVFAATLAKGQSVRYAVGPERKIWIHVARGAARVNGNAVFAGDAAAAIGEDITIDGAESPDGAAAELLLFDLS